MDLITAHYPGSDVSIKYSTHPLTPALYNEIYNELQDKKFILEELTQLLKKDSYKQLTYQSLTLNILPSPILSYKHILKVFKRLITLRAIYQLKEPIRIWFIPISLKRLFPKAGETVDAIHINGGYTYIANHTIYIYRYEEYPKVMLHEIMHNTRVHTAWSPTQLNRLYNALAVDRSSDMQPTEAIVEFWALYYQLLFISYEKPTALSFQALYEKELAWSLFQTKRLLQYRAKYFKDAWTESTNSYSYIYLKTCFLYFMPETLALRVPYSSKVLADFLIKRLKDPRLIEAIAQSPVYKTSSFRMTRLGHL